MKKIILIGLGAIAKDAVINLGNENIAYAYDNYLNEDVKVWENIPVLQFDELLEKAKDYRLVITPKKTESKFELCCQFQKLNLNYELYQINNYIPSGFVHIFGRYPEIQYKFNCTGINEWTYPRAARLRKMFQTVFQTFPDDFVNQNVNMWCFLGDIPLCAYQEAIGMGIKHVFCYATTEALRNVVIPMPDYNSFISENDNEGGWWYYNYLTFDDYKRLSSQRYVDERAFWVGNLNANKLRTELYWLGQKYPEYLDIYEKNGSYQRRDGGNQFIPPKDFVKYKYLIDVPGCSWADRTKILMQLGRPVLLVDRFEKEWYWDEMIPMKHYIPIRADFSDLIKNIIFLNEHPEIYKVIVENARIFSDNYFSPKRTLVYMKNMILQYGID